MDTTKLQLLDSKYHRHPFTDHEQLSKIGSRIISHADNVYIWDTDGNKILDAMAGLWCVNVGYGRQSLVNAATKQLQTLPYYNSFFQCTHPKAIELASLLSQYTPSHLNQVFFTNSGSEANDTMIRLIRYYWQLKDQPSKKAIISRENAYHGSTIAAASLGGMKTMHQQGGLVFPDFHHIPQPYTFDKKNIDVEQFAIECANALENKIIELGADNVAAFIAEPIQGAGGVIIPPDSYWPRIKEICRKHEILLAIDEVICGFGRLGKWFGCDYYDLPADLISIAKGLSSGYQPIGGVMISDHIVETMARNAEEFAHGFTYSAHPCACAVAIENLKIIDNENLIDQVEEDTGPYLQRCWNQLISNQLVGETRGFGLIYALELVVDKQSKKRYDDKGTLGFECRKHSIENGLVMRSVGDTMIIAPPLIINKSQIDELIEKAHQAIKLTYANLQTQ